MSQHRYFQVVSNQLTIEKLPDGSTAILDRRLKNIHSLNATATIAWEACAGGATLAEVLHALEAKIRGPVNEAIARDAIAQLQKVDLVQSEAAIQEDRQAGARRASLMRAAAMALPVVLTLALSQQRAHAMTALSLPPPTPTQ